VKALGVENQFQIIKQGSSYRSIYVEKKFAFLDVLHFTSPCSYSGYLKQWGVTEEKSIFPYQYYDTIEQLEAATSFPPIEGFYSDLTEKSVTDEDYEKSKTEFDTRRCLPGNL